MNGAQEESASLRRAKDPGVGYPLRFYDVELKERARSLAAIAGVSLHAWLLQAIAEQAEREEQQKFGMGGASIDLAR